MNTAWLPFIGAIVRWALLLALGPLVARGIVPQHMLDNVLNEQTQQIAAAIVAGALLLWSLRQKLLSAVKIRIARWSRPSRTLADISAAAHAMPLRDKLVVATDNQTPPREETPPLM